MSTNTVIRTVSPAPAIKIATVERVRLGIPAEGVLGGATTDDDTIRLVGTEACA